MACEFDWRGAPISHIQGSNSPWGSPEFPLVQPAYNHSVLYHIPSNGALLDRPPKPQIGKDKWDYDHVRLPCSSQSLYPVENQSGGTSLMRRWDMIQNALSKPLKNSNELADAILSYNTQFKHKWKFVSLHGLFNDYLEEEEGKYFFDVTLPEIAKLALALPKLIQSPIPLLKQNKNKSLSLSQQQISCLLANAFFCTFPRRNTMKKNSEYATYPHINFNVLYNCSPTDNVMEKLKCICYYFRRVCTKVPVGVMTLQRRCARAVPRWSAARQPLEALPLHVNPKDTIEDAQGLLQVDFANKYLGGGVLNHGCVQEEIRFMICPELLISLLVTEVLKPNEALIMIGCERYSDYTGYSSSFQWAGEHADATPHDSSGRRRCAVLAIDARPYSSRAQEFTKEAITRELNKAWVGFSSYTGNDPGQETAEVVLQYPGVATGNWGCGAFGGSSELKWLLQAMAAARAGRPLAYYTFGDAALRDSIARVHADLAAYHVTVGQLYDYLLKYCRTDVLRTSLNTFLKQVLDERRDGGTAMSVDYSEEKQKEDVSIFLEHLDETPDVLEGENAITQTTDVCSNKFQSNEKSAGNSYIDKTTDTFNKSSPCVDKMDDSNKMADLETPNTSRLFEEMGKLDEESGKLNLNSPQKSFFNDVKLEADDKVHFEVTSEVKKKITKKITDYFTKKPM